MLLSPLPQLACTPARPSCRARAASRHRVAPRPSVAASSTAAEAPLPLSSAGEAAKQALLSRVALLADRGIFGLPVRPLRLLSSFRFHSHAHACAVQEAERQEVDTLVRALEAASPTPAPATSPALLSGTWRLLYTTLTIRGSQRTKLGLRSGALSLGDLLQRVRPEPDAGTAPSRGASTDTVAFKLMGGFKGALTVDSEYVSVSDSRVEVKYRECALRPAQLHQLFASQLPLLLSIFNPEGWLDITFLDSGHRVGRDDKGNCFLLERVADEAE